jgi:hypothetical protein
MNWVRSVVSISKTLKTLSGCGQSTSDCFIWGKNIDQTTSDCFIWKKSIDQSTSDYMPVSFFENQTTSDSYFVSFFENHHTSFFQKMKLGTKKRCDESFPKRK